MKKQTVFTIIIISIIICNFIFFTGLSFSDDRVLSLFNAVEQNDLAEVKKNLTTTEAGLRDNNGNTILIRACSVGRLEIAKFALSRGCDINAQNNNGKTALMEACNSGKTEIVKILLENNADINTKDNTDRTALSIASNKGYDEIVKLLISKNADVDIKNNNGKTALMVASANGHVMVVKLLLDNNASINMKDNEGRTALFLASSKGKTDIVKMLLDKNANPNIESNKGRTALMEASITGNFEIIKLLVDKKAEIDKKDREGNVAFDFAKKNSFNEIAKFLKESEKSTLRKIIETTSIPHFEWGNLIMIFIGLIFVYIAIAKEYEPLLLIPIGVGIIIGNIPVADYMAFGVYSEGSVMQYLYFGIVKGIYPPLIFLGIGAMTDFSALISKPKLMLLGAAAQLGIFITFIGALALGFDPREAASIGIIGGADGPTSIYVASKLAIHLIGPIAIAGYSYIALVPVIQPPIIRLLTSKKEKLIRMKPSRVVTKTEKIIFCMSALLICLIVAPGATVLLGMLFAGNILKESGVTERLANTARNSFIDIVTIILGLTVGASTQADVFLTWKSVKIFLLGAFAFIIATAGGVIFGKIMNWFAPKDDPINPMIGAAGVSAVPDSARVVQYQAQKYDHQNFLLMHAMGPNVAGVIGSAIAAGVLLSYFLK